MSYDKFDLKILAAVQEDGRLSNLELAAQVGLSATPCARRLKRLRDEGVIRSSVTLLDPEKLNLRLKAIIMVRMDRHTSERFEAFEAEVRTYPEVVECMLVAGQAADYMVKAIVPDMTYYKDFLLNRITKLNGVSGVHSSFVLNEVVQQTRLPLDHFLNH